MEIRRWPVILMLLALVAGSAWLLLEAPPAATAGTHFVEVLGPAGPLFAGNVTAPAATALGVLEAAAGEAGFTIETRTLPGFGPRACSGLYVVAIAGHREEGTSGWEFYVDSGQGWRWVGESAACHVLAPEARLSWRFRG